MFIADEQTRADLGIGNQYQNSFSSFFKAIKTKGGTDYLFKLINSPTNNVGRIKQRQKEIKLFCDQDDVLKITKSDCDIIESYIDFWKPPLSDFGIRPFSEYLKYKIKPNNGYYNIQLGIRCLLETMQDVKSFLFRFEETAFFFAEDVKNTWDFLNLPFVNTDYRKLNAKSTAKLDKLFRSKYKNEVRPFLELLYKIDAYQAIASVYKSSKIVCFPVFEEEADMTLELKGVVHPLLNNPVRNSIAFDKKKTVLLTGPNMAGKSTFIKSVGLALYFAHIGFPVFAEEMSLSGFDGVVTAINLKDNLKMGYSHFLTEVKRLKTGVELIQEKKKIVFLFDELFKGTNSSDAIEGSYEVVDKLSRKENSIVIISTHLLELAERLKENSKVSFLNFDANIDQDKISFSYKLNQGISNSRIGMQILKNENVFELLEGKAGD